MALQKVNESISTISFYILVIWLTSNYTFFDKNLFDHD